MRIPLLFGMGFALVALGSKAATPVSMVLLTCAGTVCFYVAIIKSGLAQKLAHILKSGKAA